jgi:aspartyl-tRNA(Asn)/glutamyl-tRNA(Gln) amidotransferase subunit B
MAAYETVIGLECHVELATVTKMFCGCRVEFGAEPNTNVCPVCLGHPGSLPVPNEKAIESIVKIGLALGSQIAPHSVFSRKNYFYPDMPKNYQISQFDLPTCVGGQLEVELPDGGSSTVGITRVHMEEDTGKTSHGSASGRIHDADSALLDFNRAGVPLVECVSEPDMRSPEEAGAYLRTLRATLESLDVSDVRMEEGSLRCDANVSLRPEGATEFGTKVEIKNMNSVRSMERAITYEIERQSRALDAGEPIVQETRHWDEDAGATKSMRSKEEAFDYRYFPEPDIPALDPDPAWVERVRATLPELPAARRARYESDFRLKPEVVKVLVADRAAAHLFEETVALGTDPAAAANWITQDLAANLNRLGIDIPSSGITAELLLDLIRRVESNDASLTSAKKGLEALLDDFSSNPETRTATTSLDAYIVRQVSDTGELGSIVDQVIADNPDVVEKFRGGNEGVIGFLVGQLMKASGGSANPKLAQELLRERLSG